MTVLVVPEMDAVAWPTLGPQVCDFIERYLVHGPGDLRGVRAKLDDEWRALTHRAYEVYPEGHPRAGRRRFRRVCVSKRKGTAKTEWAMWIGAAELHRDGPVRCDGWRDVFVHGEKRREPVGRGVIDPYLPLVSYTEEQTDLLAYGTLKAILEESELADDFDIGLERIVRIEGDGKAESLASAPNARDGARTTWEHFDETHHWTLPRLKDAQRIMLANLPKRFRADPWALETTTAYATGDNSVAEDTHKYALSIAAGGTKAADEARLFFFHRQASDEHELTTAEGVREAVIEASGPTVGWSDIDGIVEQFFDPTADRPLLERLWLNRPVQGGGKYFPASVWAGLARTVPPADGAWWTSSRAAGGEPVPPPPVMLWPDNRPPAGDLIVAGFDGSRFHDATALIATHVETGFQWPVGIWAPPARIPQTGEEWEVDKAAVKAAFEAMMETWTVWRVYCDPPEWESEIAAWQSRWTDKVVVEWWTRRLLQMAQALEAYRGLMMDGGVSHDGDATFAAHIANCVIKTTNFRRDAGGMYQVVRKERPDSMLKIDAAVAGTLSWEAREDAIAAGATAGPKRSKYEDEGLARV